MRFHHIILISIIILFYLVSFFCHWPLESAIWAGLCVYVFFYNNYFQTSEHWFVLSLRSWYGSHCISSFECLVQILIKALGFYWPTTRFCNTSYDPLRIPGLLDRNQCLQLCLTNVFGICLTVWVFLIIMIIP